MFYASANLNSLTVADLDILAWQAICNWPERSGLDVIREDIDYGVLTRYFLWDKVPRAIRAQVNPANFQFEQALLKQLYAQHSHVENTFYPRWKKQIKRPKQAVERLVRLAQLKFSDVIHPQPVLFVPRQHFHLQSTLSALADEAAVRLVAPLEHGANPNVSCFCEPLRKRPPDLAFAAQLGNAIVKGLQAFDISLLPEDQRKLQQQLEGQMRLIRQVEAELAIAQPKAMLLFADNHSPSQEYVAIANRENIPTIVLQHGLDCERYCLNEAYATNIAVWGNSRQQRYQTASGRQPDLIEVTGNPEYDERHLPSQLRFSGHHWLWVTRPHGPEKCYLPSRQPQEGLEILNALLNALLATLAQTPTARLTIKPHPLDYRDRYEAEIKKHPAGERVTLSQQPLSTLFPQASLVISEDSTAAMEAMFFGKPVIHAHFASSRPVLPLVEYQAALPAFSPEMLRTALANVQSLSGIQQKQMQQGQHRFIQDYAGSLDGQACQRVTALITQITRRKIC